MRTVHVITGLGIGGAETMLAKLLEAEVSLGYRRTVEVICLGAEGPLAERIRTTGIPLTCLGLGPGGAVGLLSGLRLLASRLAAARPDVVQCWMYHADLLGGLVARFAAPMAACVWSIRASSMPHPASLRTRAVIRACAVLSSVIPARIISCSKAAADLHVRMGYAQKRIVVIPNGFDLHRFAPDKAARVALREELGLPGSTPLIGCVARFDPQKDFPTLFRTFERVAMRNSEATLVLVGHGCSGHDSGILAMIPDVIRNRVKLLGVRRDIPRLTAALDIAILTSAYGEGFPNVLGEAIACGVPCVATDVGDCRDIVGDDGTIAAVGDDAALAEGVIQILSQTADERVLAGARLRERALHDYDLHLIARRYWQVQDDIRQSSNGTRS